jgi:hypothetical protein
MCIQIILSYKFIQIFSMYSPPKQEDPSDSDNQLTLNINSTCSDVDSPIRSYALIETNPDELEHIIDLLRQFFPKTKIIEYNNPHQSSRSITTSQQTTIESIGSSSNFPISPSTNSQVSK